MRKVSNILKGVILIAIGLIWALSSLEVINFTIFFRGWWTLFIIVPSILGIIEKPKDISGYIGVLIGVSLLLAARDIISFEAISKLVLPVLLVIIGIKVIFKDSTGNKEIIQKVSEIDKDGTEIYSATFSENKAKLSGDEFNNAKLDACFGSVELDLSECDITHDGVISASAIFGGVEIILPKNVNVKVKSTGIFGGTTNKVKNSKDENSNTIYIESLALFGGVEIK